MMTIDLTCSFVSEITLLDSAVCLKLCSDCIKQLVLSWFWIASRIAQ